MSLPAGRRLTTAFTLIEAVCSLAIAAVLLAAVYGTLSVTARGELRSRRAMREARLFAGVARVLREDVAFACRFPGAEVKTWVSEPAEESGRKPVLAFFTTNTLSTAGSEDDAVFRVEYFTRPESGGYALVRRETPVNGGGDLEADGGFAEELIAPLLYWRGRFFDGETWEDRWESDVPPHAARIEFAAATEEAGAKESRVVTVAPLVSPTADPAPSVAAPEAK